MGTIDISTLFTEAQNSLAVALNRLGECAPANSTSIPAYLDLVHKISTRDSDFLLYLGSGVTKSADLRIGTAGASCFNPPDWHGLLDGLFNSWAQGHTNGANKLTEWATRAGLKDKVVCATDLLKVFDKLDLAKRISDLFPSKNIRNNRIRELVQPDDDLTIHSLLLNEIIRLPSTVIVTTNYDDVIEKALIERGRAIQAATRTATGDFVSESPTHDENFLHPSLSQVHAIFDDGSLTSAYGKPGVRLFYLHGSVVHQTNNRYNIVFDRYEYAALSQRGSRIFDHVRHKIETMPAIYIGFGLDDPSFNLIEDSRAQLNDQSPHSYAFVSAATSDEQRAWQSRNLHLIQYGWDHKQLIPLIKTLAEVRKFLCWADPDRTPEIPQNGDRTVGYLSAALKQYDREDFEGAVKNARAALASTFFWNEAHAKEALLRLVDVRVRLGLSHYKQRDFDSFPEALKRATINAYAAESTLQNIGSPESDNSVQRCSLENLLARLDYTAGKFESALSRYNKVISIAEEKASKVLDCELEKLTYDQLNYVQCYVYAFCQSCRIEYQWKPKSIDRVDGANKLQRLGDKLSNLTRKRWRFEDLTFDIGIEPYFRNSLATLSLIATWFSGRHLIGGFADLIPTVDERRTPDSLDRVTRSLLLLEKSDCGNVEHNVEHNGANVSGRWQALRYRYLARAYALRWFLTVGSKSKQQSGLEHGHDESNDLVKAFEAASKALEIVGSSNLQRDRIVTHQEIARIAIIAAYASIIPSKADGASHFALYTAIHHLDSSQDIINNCYSKECEVKEFDIKGGVPSIKVELQFLSALTIRMQGYVRLIGSATKVPPYSIKRNRLAPIMDASEDLSIANKMHLTDAEVQLLERYELFDAVRLYYEIDAEKFQRRVRSLADVFTALEAELSQVPLKQVTGGPVNLS
jgi:SIR2-like domain